MSDFVFAGKAVIFSVPRGSVLTVVADANSSGRAGRAGDLPGGGDIPASYRSIAVATQSIFGTFASNTRILVEALTGRLSVSVDVPLFDVALQTGKIEPFTGNRTVLPVDNGTVFRCEDSSNVTITVSNSLPEGFNVGFIQWAAGTITLSPGAGATKRAGGSATSAQYQRGSLIVGKNSNGTSAEYVVGGDFA